ncbi:hypothetical protein GCE86_31215 [Micromonospora terminaliae]|uniref:Uncharacterized protein n=1 Tax=Micromonospora terminaliae TaxID=1914461 RepID=A0AAJ2ZJH3_9ACTN|nr:hypothetical protein [Micromonospora terminaliae]NES30831.1 hypothetical protein [Micromonospora terminaliae]QGL51119.1 hypothetical protein GCE86_31215 [Micromonospora terminaliae]
MPAEKPQPPEEQPEDRYVVDDALWVVPSGSYVDSGPPLEGSLFDDPQRLNRAWHLTMETLRSEARESEEKKQQIEEQARTFIDEAERAAAPDGQAEKPADGRQPETRGESVAGLIARLERLVRATRKPAVRHSA